MSHNAIRKMNQKMTRSKRTSNRTHFSYQKIAIINNCSTFADQFFNSEERVS
jgi:hypothetical protein